MEWGAQVEAPPLLALEEWEGQTPKESNETYHERSELSSSDIKWMLESPAHFFRRVLEKRLLEKEINEAFNLGSCAHGCFLEQSTENFVASPGFDRRTKQGKSDYKAFVAEHSGKRIVSPEQHVHLMRMFDVISSNQKASNLASNGMIEESFLYKDPDTGIACKFRPDVMSLERGYIADYKTAQSASPHEFSKACVRYGYHLSAAHYLVGAERLFKGKIREYFFIVQESDEPYAVAIYRMTESDIERSKELRKRIVLKIKACIETNVWRDWSHEVLSLSIPGYGFEFS